jgi:hypothetical protein
LRRRLDLPWPRRRADRPASGENDAGPGGFLWDLREWAMPRHDDVGRERDALGLDLIVFLTEKSLPTVVASSDGVIRAPAT